jgi:cell division septation protein DedD
MQDEGVHEIQLNGKQLVFLFMAATVVAVVIFLCGVMVGRGVPTPRGAVIANAGGGDVDPTALPQEHSSAAVTDSDTSPVTAGETLTYTERLEDPNPAEETLKPVAEPTAAVVAPVVAEPAVANAAPFAGPPSAAATPAVPPAVQVPTPVPAVTKAPAAPVVAKAPVAPVAAVAEKATPEPVGNGFVVQVAAVRTRTDADAMARRLSAKGYPAFVTTSGSNFRVRIGKYDTRRDAESVAGRLEREEQFKPWITR